MSKKIKLLICFSVMMPVVFAQLLPHQYGNKTLDSLKVVLSTTTQPTERFNIINNILVTTNALTGSVDSAACIELLEIAQQVKNDSLLATSYNWVGSYFSLNKGDNAIALEYYFKALPLAEKVNDKRRISSLYFDIALIYVALHNDEEAVKFDRKGFENLPDPAHPLYDYMLAQFQRGMATYFLSTRQPDSALHYCQAFSETSRRSKSLLFEYNAMHLTAAAYTLSGESEMADIYFKKDIAISGDITGSMARLRFGQDYIPFLLATKKNAEAKEQSKALLNIGEAANNNNLKLAGAGFMRQVYDSLRNKDSAYYYSRMEAAINAAIFSQDNINKIQSLAFNEKIRLIEDEAKKTEEARQRKENIQYALIALGIITLLILYLLLSRSFITNTKLIEFFGVIALLIVFEFLNLLLHPFLEKVTHRSPVLMLLALVCIAALLVPLHHKIEHWATKKLVEKNKQIRLAAARKTIEQLENNPT